MAFYNIINLIKILSGYNTGESMKNKILASAKTSGFTLAEVLITLGIIGVVAALTIPTLLNNVQDKVLETQVGKAKTIVANGYKLMMARDELFETANLKFLSGCNAMNNTSCVSTEHKRAFQIFNDSTGSLKPEIMPAEYKIENEDTPSPFKWEDTKYMYMTGDGMVFGVTPDDNLTSFDVFVDVNAKSQPNTALKDLRKFRFSSKGQLFDVSEELTKTNECRFDNIGACTSKELCYSIELPEDDENGMWAVTWEGDSCRTYQYW